MSEVGREGESGRHSVHDGNVDVVLLLTRVSVCWWKEGREMYDMIGGGRGKIENGSNRVDVIYWSSVNNRVNVNKA